MEREKAKVEEYEASLVKEEKILEGIRDSLKGTSITFVARVHTDVSSGVQTRRRYSTTRSK